MMTDEQEYAARSQLKWRRDGNAWVLLHGRRRMGRVVPGMDDLNLSRAKDRVLAQAVREVAWERAKHPSKSPVKGGVFPPAASLAPQQLTRCSPFLSHCSPPRI
jgi:hypothetical protein